MVCARCSDNAMVPFSAFATTRWLYGSPRLERYNGRPSMEIQGENAPGISSGDAMALMENLAAKSTGTIGYDWTGMSYQEKLASGQAFSLYAISIVVFSCALLHCTKAGQFRSRLCWSCRSGACRRGAGGLDAWI